VSWLVLFEYASPIAAQPKAAQSPKSHISFAGKWTGTLKTESQDSYRGNNAKGKHTVSSEVWIFKISDGERTISFHPTNWKGPEWVAFLIHKNDHTLTWHLSGKASAGTPFTVWRNGQKIATGITTLPDYDADWTMRVTSDRTATIVCGSNREDIYARITDTHITGMLKKD
jgi:hypothetical protein